MARILLIDEHSIIRIGTRCILEKQKDVCVSAEAENRLETLKQLKMACPDLAIMGIELGREDGLEMIKEMKALFPEVKILVMSKLEEEVYAERVIRAGAEGFLSQNEASEHLLDAVRTVLSGGVYMSPEAGARLLGWVLHKNGADVRPPVSALSDRELYVYQMIGRGLATKEIADNLHLSPKTVETYRENIKSKLSLKTAEALRGSACSWIQRNS